MKKISISLLALCLFSTGVLAQSQYYYSDKGKVSLKEDLSTFIIHTKSESILEKVQTDKKIRGVQKVEVFSHKKYAVVQGASLNKSAIAGVLGLSDQVLDISPGLKLEDGFTMYTTHQVVYKAKSKESQLAIKDILSNFDVASNVEKYGTHRVEIRNVSDAFLIANTLYESGLTEYAHPDFYAPKKQDTDPLFGEQFQMHNTGQTIDGYSGLADMDCNALEAWGLTLGSNSITVAVIDDGVEDHEDLNDSSGNSRLIGGFTPANNGNGGTTSSSNHGEACAGIIGASHNNIGVQGLAPLVKLLSVNIFFGGESTQDIADGITWAKNNGADVLSNSWGYTSCTANFSNINNAISDANSNGRNGLGSIIVFASGNGYKTCVDYPANNSNVVAVGAFTNQGNKSDYSNGGSALDIAAPSNAVSPQPGAGVRTIDRMGSSGYSSGNYTSTFGGTSAACPVVAGVAALVLGYNPNLTSTELKNILYSTAIDMGTSGNDTNFGAGRVNAFGALQAAGGSAPTCSDGVQNGQETGVDCGGPDCSPCVATCSDGIQNGQETGVDCGGPTCPSCPVACSDNEVVLTIIFDNYPEETSWLIVNAGGSTVASGGTYASQADGSTLTIDECLIDGCYDFIINDTYGDGICCSYGSGSYSLVSGGSVLASGGSFASSETTNFCLGNGPAPDTEAPTVPTALTANNISQTTADLTWNASSDNVGVSGYNVFVDGNFQGTTTSTTYAVVGLTASTTYTMAISAFDAAGNTSGTASTNVTTQDIPGGGGTDEVFAHYFESGWDGWVDGGTDCFRYSGSRSYEGNRSIRLRDNSGVSSSMTSSSYNLSNYSNVELKFYFYPNSMENGEDFWVRYNDGNGWQTIATYSRGTSFENGQFYSATIAMDGSAYNLSSNASFRIQCDASGNNDQIYVDQVTLTGFVPGATLSDASISGLEVMSGKRLGADEDFEEVIVSPNPTFDIVTVTAEDEMSKIVIVGIDGRLLESLVFQGSQRQIDMSHYKAGMYIFQIHTEDEVIAKRVVKH